VPLGAKRNTAGGTAWTTQLVDDVGNVVQVLDRGAVGIAANGVAATPSVWVGANDGFYTLRVRAAVRSDDGEDVTEAVQYLAITQGKVREVDFANWHAKSRDGLAHPIPVGGAL
jgi:hypothetical protein